jgi:signal transduction histidine kinase
MAEGLRELLVGDWWRYAISGLGALLLAVGVGSVLIDAQLTGTEVVQVSSLVVLCLLLIGVGARVAVVVRDSTELYGIFGWTSLGVIALAALGAWYQWVLETVETAFESALLFLSVLAAGALFGAVVGYYNVRVRALLERAGREQARREFADEQREALTSLNDILRHQILNDLSAISGRAELLESGKVDADDAAASIVDHCDHVDATVTRIETVVDALKHVGDTGEVALPEVVATATATVQEEHPDLKIDSDGVGDLSVRADELLHIALAELLDNTAVYTDESVVRVTARETPESVVITVTDEGPDVDVDPDRLFEPNTRGRDSEGDGLGLFIAKLVVERYDGTISYVDSNDEGATFEIEIPTQSRREYDFPPGGALQ